MTQRRVALELLVVALLALAAYARSISLPLLEDDYGNIEYAQVHGPASALPSLFHDGVFRLRATSSWFMYGLWKALGLAPRPFRWASLLLHVVNCWLVYGVVSRLARAAPAAPYLPFWTAAFFAVHEGHQEAIMWFSACNELLLFLFGAGALLLWFAAAQEKRPGPRAAMEAGSVAAFALALLSKESAVVWLPLFLLASAPQWRRALRLWPHALLALVAVASVWSTRQYSFRFADGSFSLHAPFWITLPRSFGRLLWVWGWLALAALAWFRPARTWRLAAGALAWMAIALSPYMFLTYSTQIPSRQTYLAGAGLALLFAQAMATLAGRPGIPRRLAAVAAAAMIVSNIGYLWTKKRAQFLARAEPTEQLIRLARQTPGPIWVQCFPRNRYIAEEAVKVGANRPNEILVWTPAEAAARGARVTFCYQER